MAMVAVPMDSYTSILEEYLSYLIAQNPPDIETYLWEPCLSVELPQFHRLNSAPCSCLVIVIHSMHSWLRQPLQL